MCTHTHIRWYFMYWQSNETLCVHIRTLLCSALFFHFIIIIIFVIFVVYNKNCERGTNDRPKVNKPPTASTTSAPHTLFFRAWKQLNTKNVTLVMSLFVTYISSSFYRRWHHRSRPMEYVVDSTSKECVHRCARSFWLFFLFRLFRSLLFCSFWFCSCALVIRAILQHWSSKIGDLPLSVSNLRIDYLLNCVPCTH